MEILHNFGIQPTLLLAQIVNFLVILFLLRKFFYGTITKALDDRKKRIEESLKNADLIEEKLQKTQEESALIIEKAQNQATELITQAKAEAQRIADVAATETRKTMEETMQETKAMMQKESEQMRRQVEGETLAMVAHVVKKVLGRNMSSKEKQELTKKSVFEIEKTLE